MTIDRNPNQSNEATASIDWSLEESSILIPWDDGHTPETQPKGQPGVRFYPDFHQPADNNTTVFVSETNNPQLADEIYKFTIEQGRPSWGSYVTMEEIAEYEKQSNECNAAIHPQDEKLDSAIKCTESNQQQQQLSIQAASIFLDTASHRSDDSFYPRWTEHDSKHRAHGVAVWGLAAKSGSEVAYHIDYAEWIRYRDGVTILPALAGTWQCTKGFIEGGTLCIAARDGLDHYRKHGYKGALAPVNTTDDTDEWIRIPYKYNQMIVMAGHLPHLSTTVKSIENEQQRVIVGFNVFLRDAGPAAQQAPEHSEAFQNAVRRLQQQRRQLRLVQANPLLKRRLVEAKREKVKEIFRQSQEKVDEEIRNQLGNSGPECTVAEIVQELFERIGSSSTGVWPCSINDVEAHLFLRWKQGMLVSKDNSFNNDSILRMKYD